MLQFAAIGIIGLFLPIYLLINFGFEVKYVMLWYLAGHLGYALSLPLGVQFLNKFGLRRSIRVSVFFDALVYTCVYFISKEAVLFAVASALFLIPSRLFFWMPFHVDFAKFTDRLNRGKEVSLIWATKSFLGIVLPVVSGLLIAHYGFGVVFIVAIVLFLSAGIPFLALPRTKERYSWSPFETVKKFFSKKCRALVIANFSNGAENAVALVIWPIFIWQLLQGDFVNVGILSSLIILIGVILQLVVGKYTDLFNKRKLLHWGSAFYAAGWLVKIFVLTGMHIFLVGSYHQFARIFKDTPFDTLNYEILADHGHLVDEYTVIKEMAVQLGKVFILAFAIVVVFFFGLNWTFVLAALASLFINIL
jgi:YQGE family putative transporter